MNTGIQIGDDGGRMDRIARLRQEMHTRGIDTLICLKPQNSFYLTGFNPVLYSHPVVAVLPVTGDPVLLAYALRDDHARLAGVKNVRLFGSWSTKKTMGPDWLGALQTILEEFEVTGGTVGIEGDFLPVNVAREIQRRFHGARFEDVSDIIMKIRMSKDDHEIALTRSAAAIADIGMDVALAAAAERESEREISIRAMAAMNRAWLERFPDVEVADFGSLEGAFTTDSGATVSLAIGWR